MDGDWVQIWNQNTGHLEVSLRDGQHIVIETLRKPGMSIFTVFGSLNGRPCHWTSEGKYRMDDKPDSRDVPSPLRIDPKRLATH